MAQRLIDDTEIAALDGLLLSLETILAGLRAKPTHTEPVIVPEPAGISPTASFTATPLSGASPLTVQFSNKSTGTLPLTYKWDMSDGAGNLPQNTQQNPAWRFWPSAPKKYTITLTVTNAFGTHTIKRPDYIVVGNIPATTTPTTGDTIPTYGAPDTVSGYAIGG
jgi:PKD repeat protein